MHRPRWISRQPLSGTSGSSFTRSHGTPYLHLILRLADGHPRQFSLGPDGAMYAMVDKVTVASASNGEIWRGVVSGSSITWTKVHAITYKFPGCRMTGIAYVAPAATTAETTTTDAALTGRKGMLVLSSSTGKWTSYAY